MTSSRHILAILSALFSLSMISEEVASAQTDSLLLETSVVVSRRRSSSLKLESLETLSWSLNNGDNIPGMLGVPDPIKTASFLPGVQTGNEFDGGIHIDGCENSHNIVSMDGVPVYGANHLFGLFSIFNTDHFSKFSLQRNSLSSNRLGGTLDISSKTITPARMEGVFNLGMLSSQGSMAIPLHRKTREKPYESSLRISARASYINAIYGNMIKMDGTPAKYGFDDFNLTFVALATDTDRVWMDAYYGYDMIGMEFLDYNCDVDAKWGNMVSSVHWKHSAGKFDMSQSLYYSRYDSDPFIRLYDDGAYMASDMKTIGYQSKIDFLKGLSLGVDLGIHRAVPQAEEERAVEASATISRDFCLGYRWEVVPTLKTTVYAYENDRPFFSLSPSIDIKYDMGQKGHFNANLSVPHQYLFQTGFSSVGLPTEFWMLAGGFSRPQYAYSSGLSYSRNLFSDMISVSVGAHYKMLFNQVEYRGSAFEALGGKHDVYDFLLKGNGRNYGVNILLQKLSGRLTGWISYSVGRSLRRFDHPDYTKVYPSNHERLHELNVIATYNLARWNIQGAYVLAGGTPFTAPESFYLLSERLVFHYAEHNSSRLRPYSRMDFSVSHSLHSVKGINHRISLSVYNALLRKNDLFYRLKYDDGAYSYRPLNFVIRCLPSLNYRIEF